MHSKLRPHADVKLMLPPENMVVHVQTNIDFWALPSAGVTGHSMCMFTTVSLISITHAVCIMPTAYLACFLQLPQQTGAFLADGVT